MTKLDRILARAVQFFLFVFVLFMPFKIAVTQSSLGLALFCWAGRVFITKGSKPQSLKLEWAIGLFIVANLISLPFSSNVIQSVVYLKRLLLIPVAYLAATEVRDNRTFQYLIYSFIASLTLYSVLGIQSYFQNPIERVSNIHNSMTAGGITMIASLLTLTLAIRAQSWKTRPVWTILFLINLACLVLTNTRGSWLGFFAGALVLIWMTNKKLFLALAPLALVFYFFTPEAFQVRVNHMFDPYWDTNWYRILMWSLAGLIVLKHPLVGIGDVAMNEHVRHLAHPETLYQIGALGHFHSNYVHIAVTLGLFGFLAFIFLTGSVIYRLVKKSGELIKAVPGLQSSWTLAALAVFIAFSINGFFEWNYGDAEIATMIWFILGLALRKPLQDI